jgi:tol-pal system protein YbgF
MRRAIVFLLLGSLAALSMGCAVADTGAFGRLQNEMMDLRKEVNALKAAQASAPAGRPAEGEVAALQKTVGDLVTDSDRLKSDQLAASSRVEETQAEQKRIANRLQDLDKRMAVLEEKTGKASGAPTAAAPAASPAADPEKAAAWKSPEEMYEFAVGQVKGGNTKKGREILAAFVAQNPNHKLVPNALYWKGESYYAEKDYENAILAFQDVVDKYPAGDKAPDAVLKQGLSFLALKDQKNAKILLDLVVTKYPKSSAAELAKKKLAELK